MHTISKNIPARHSDSDRLFLQSDFVFTKQGQESIQFEPGIVLDVVLDDKHILFNEILKGGLTAKANIIVPDEFPLNYKNDSPQSVDKSYCAIGVILVRLCHSQQNLDKEDVVVAYPMDNSITTYPVLNELVQVTEYLGRHYYSNKLNSNGFVNSSADFRYESTYGRNSGNRSYEGKDNLKGPESKLDSTKKDKYPGMRGILGNYFWFNKNIRSLRRREGDTIIESRFGQSIRFGAYDDDRNNDVGMGADYKGDKDGVGGGNPFILIRNRQRLLAKDSEQSLHDKLNKIKDINSSPNEKNVGGYMIEDINNDGSSIHITSGMTVSPFRTTCYKTCFSSDVAEEQPAFSPSGATNFVMPTLDGNQIVIHSDRLIFASRFNETLHFSKKRYAITTDSEYTVDAHEQIVFTTNTKTVINSPVIYLGEYDSTSEPALLGQTTVNWMYELCNWLIDHTHWYKHNHPRSGGPSPEQTQLSVQLKQLKLLRDNLHTLMSRRVFVTGGGYAPGSNGGELS
jgi:hypothetical protein